MQISQKGLDILKEFEGLRLEAYRCSAGVWTIGYGWTQNVKRGDVWTREKAEHMLLEGVKPYEKAVQEAVGDAKTSQNQYDAMVSLCYNIGPGNFKKSSVARLHREGKYAQAAAAFMMWVKGGGKIIGGLIKRRNKEKALYLS